MSEYIVFVSKEHYNQLGIVRTLGEAGIKPVTVIVEGDLRFVGQSKYVKKRHYVKSSEDGVKLIIDQYARKGEKSFILTGDDVAVVFHALSEGLTLYVQTVPYLHFFIVIKKGFCLMDPDVRIFDPEVS